MTILINPFSGTKMAKKIWENVSIVFGAANIDVNLIETTHAGHAEEYANTTPLSEFKDGIATISGDGLLCEVLNGLLKRKDWKEATKIPLGIIVRIPGRRDSFSFQMSLPSVICMWLFTSLAWWKWKWARSIGGGDDPAARCVLHRKRQEAPFGYHVCPIQRQQKVLWLAFHRMGFVCCFIPVHGTSGASKNPFCSATGLCAAVDFESEVIRFAGSARFTLWALKKIVDWDVHKGMLFYYPHDAPPKTDDEVAHDDDDAGPPVEHDKPQEDDSNHSSEEHNPSEASPKPEGVADSAAAPSYPTHGPPLKYLPLEDLTHWRGSAGSFMFFLASNVTHIALDMHAAPKAQMADGCLDMVIIRKSTRLQMAKLLTDLETGKHVDHPDVEYIKCRAFVLRPEAHKSNILLGVDGEKIEPTTNLQVEVHQGLMQIFCK
jgi:sphingosine kinase